MIHIDVWPSTGWLDGLWGATLGEDIEDWPDQEADAFLRTASRVSLAIEEKLALVEPRTSGAYVRVFIGGRSTTDALEVAIPTLTADVMTGCQVFLPAGVHQLPSRELVAAVSRVWAFVLDAAGPSLQMSTEVLAEAVRSAEAEDFRVSWHGGWKVSPLGRRVRLVGSMQNNGFLECRLEFKLTPELETLWTLDTFWCGSAREWFRRVSSSLSWIGEDEVHYVAPSVNSERSDAVVMHATPSQTTAARGLQSPEPPSLKATAGATNALSVVVTRDLDAVPMRLSARPTNGVSPAYLETLRGLAQLVSQDNDWRNWLRLTPCQAVNVDFIFDSDKEGVSMRFSRGIARIRVNRSAASTRHTEGKHLCIDDFKRALDKLRPRFEEMPTPPKMQLP